MKKSILIIALALIPFLMKAQMPMGGMPMGGGMPPMGMGMGMGMGATMQDLPEETIVEHTDKMVAELKLDENQRAQLLELNKKYLGKIEYPVVLPPVPEKPMDEAVNEAPNGPTDMAAIAERFNNMTAEDREKMMSSMNEMQDMMAQMEDNQLEYENGLKSIFTKKQMRTWKRAKSRYNNEQRMRMEQEMSAGFGRMGGGGFPGGGGFGGGGFGGGFPGGF